jgi:eukaryotic-like serine/threonine-protein kinase
MTVAPSELHHSVVDQVHTRIGTTLKGKWRIDAVIGFGGMAAVYSATSTTGRVAIKMLHPALSLSESIRKRFAREGYVANTIGHPGVARVLDDGVTEDGAAFLVMELLEGETAAARAARFGGKLPISEVAYVGDALAEVLAAAHACRVIHRDVKPENVFITFEGRVVMLDFGIARVADAAGVSESATRTGTMMGTPAFMPPEQARGRANEMDASSDVWALGATLFWLASGRVVHEGDTPNEQLVAAATLPAASLARVAPEVPAPLVQVIDRALQFAKENRFKDAVAMKQALHAAVQGIAWGSGRRPGLVPQDEAPTVQQRSPVQANALTIGPVEVALPPSRATMFLRAALIGGLLGTAVLGIVAVLSRRGLERNEPAVPLSVSTPVTSAVPTASSPMSAMPPPTPSRVATVEDEHPATSATVVRTVQQAPTRPNWLDRRK